MADLVTQEWLESPTAIRTILVQVDTTIPKYLSIGGLNVSSQHYEPCILTNFSITSTIGIDYSSSISYSDIEINNANGERDSWLTEVWVNKAIRVYIGDITWNTITNFKQVFNGIVGDIDSKSRDTLNITIRDSLQKLNYPISENKLGNYNPMLLSPYDNRNKESIKPLVFGEVFNIAPLLTSPELLEYMVNDGSVEQIIEVRDNGIPVSIDTDPGTTVLVTSTTSNSLTLGAKTFLVANTSSFAMDGLIRIYYTPNSANSLIATITGITLNTSITVSVVGISGTGGPYSSWSITRIPIPAGSFRLLYQPAGVITASVQGMKQSTTLSTGAAVASYNNGLVNIIATIIRLYGKNTPSIDTSIFNTAAGYPLGSSSIGIYALDRFNIFTLCSDLAKSANMSLFISTDGKIALNQLIIPTSALAGNYITDTNILLNTLSIKMRPEILGGVKLGYAKNWTVQTGVVTDIPELHKEEFAKEWYEIRVDTDPTTISTYGLSTEIPIEETYLVDLTEATLSATNKIDLRDTTRTIYGFTATSKFLLLTVGTAVNITSSRFNLGSGKFGIVISSTPNWITGTIDLEVLV